MQRTRSFRKRKKFKTSSLSRVIALEPSKIPPQKSICHPSCHNFNKLIQIVSPKLTPVHHKYKFSRNYSPISPEQNKLKPLLAIGLQLQPYDLPPRKLLISRKSNRSQKIKKPTIIPNLDQISPPKPMFGYKPRWTKTKWSKVKQQPTFHNRTRIDTAQSNSTIEIDYDTLYNEYCL